RPHGAVEGWIGPAPHVAPLAGAVEIGHPAVQAGAAGFGIGLKRGERGIEARPLVAGIAGLDVAARLGAGASRGNSVGHSLLSPLAVAWGCASPPTIEEPFCSPGLAVRAAASAPFGQDLPGRRHLHLLA